MKAGEECYLLPLNRVCGCKHVRIMRLFFTYYPQLIHDSRIVFFLSTELYNTRLVKFSIVIWKELLVFTLFFIDLSIYVRKHQ